MRRSWLAVLMIAGVVGSCGKNKRHTEMAPEPASTLHVVNHHWSDIDVYVVRDGQRMRVGMVTATTDQLFTLAPTLTRGASTLQLVAHAIGSAGGIVSESFAARPGMQISWTLESNLSRSSLAIY